MFPKITEAAEATRIAEGHVTRAIGILQSGLEAARSMATASMRTRWHARPTFVPLAKRSTPPWRSSRKPAGQSRPIIPRRLERARPRPTLGGTCKTAADGHCRLAAFEIR
jgi:hypothetical protein